MPEQETEEEPDQPEESVVEAVEYDLELEDRKWLVAIMRVLTLHADNVEQESCPRVQHAWNQMKIAAFERVGRIMRNDLPEDQA